MRKKRGIFVAANVLKQGKSVKVRPIVQNNKKPHTLRLFVMSEIDSNYYLGGDSFGRKGGHKRS